jgi:CRP-like cAMP-binding protein
MLPRLIKGGAEQLAIEEGEIDAIVDHASSNIILLPAARRALREVESRAAAADREAHHEASVANRLLAALPRMEYRGLLAGLEPLTLKFGEVLHEPGAPIAHVYFPIDCVISLLSTAQDRPALEVGLVGYEGMVGVSLALGTEVSSVRALVQASGTAMRVKAARFHEALRQCPSLQRELCRYADAKLALARQTVACNCFHTVGARLARWLLMTSDRVRSEEFFLTQAFVADMLGVRRSTVNLTASALQQRKLISYRRGNVTILDRKGLEAASCRCYTRI